MYIVKLKFKECKNTKLKKSKIGFKNNDKKNYYVP